jgi:formate hydrogenlyase transcriptional activator
VMSVPDHSPVTAAVLETPRDTRAVVEPPREARGNGNALEFFSAAIESLRVGVILAGRDGVIARVNGEIQRLFGQAPAELIGRSVDVLIPGMARSVEALLQKASPGRPEAPAEAKDDLFGRRKDGSEVPVELSLAPFSFRGAPFVLASVLDRSQRDRHPALQAALDERLEFERLISELGAEFVNLPPADVDRTIEDALGRLVRTLGLDRSALFQVDADGDFVHTHQWTRPGWAPPPPRVAAREQFPWHLAQVRAGELVAYAALDDVPNAIDRDSLRRLGTRSSVIVPLIVGGEVWGALTFAAIREPRSWTPAEINRLRVVALLFANAVARKMADERLRKAIDEMTGLRDRLREENLYLRHELRALIGTPPIVGHSPSIRHVLEQVRQVGPTDSTVLLAGETGTGKTLLAAQIHEMSARSEHAMVRVNCARASVAWMEDELVGSEQGLNAEPRHVGRLELASGSTVFFDEIADLPLEAQASLTRLLQDRQIQPVGGSRPLRVDVRIIAATRKDLKRCIEEGAFRDDLYYRLNVFPIHVPPLRDRREDIPLLVWRFVDEFSEAYGKPVDAIDQASMAALQAYSWPGNARELRNVVERAMIVPTGRRLRIPLLPNGSGSKRRSETLAALEKEHITSILAACGGRIHGRGGAAARLGLSPKALGAKITRLGIHRPRA